MMKKIYMLKWRKSSEEKQKQHLKKLLIHRKKSGPRLIIPAITIYDQMGYQNF